MTEYSSILYKSLSDNREEFLYNSLRGSNTCFIVTDDFAMTGVSERMITLRRGDVRQEVNTFKANLSSINLGGL